MLLTASICSLIFLIHTKAFIPSNTEILTSRIMNPKMIMTGGFDLHNTLLPYHIITSTMLSFKDIPSEISSDDAYSGALSISQIPMPNVEISQLNGSENLGTLLWSFVLFNGLFTTIGKPGDWILNLIAKVVQQEEKEWYVDFKAGFRYQCPPVVDAIRFAFFITIGYYANFLWTASLGGDPFWGWSTGACLAIPSGLLSVARDKPPTRKESEFQDTLQQSLTTFLKKRVESKRDGMMKEEDLVSAFRISRPELRSIEVLPERMLKKALRKAVGGKPNKAGVYKGLYLSDTDLDVKYALEKALRESRRLRAEASRAAEGKGVGTQSSGVLVEGGGTNQQAPVESSSGKDFVR